ncbi:MAG: hypothetical protein LBR52_06640 [Prevotellaceae bacterium]|jgi:hypothetical protein|nr:hypothetical protein [Prevotellaceae bacterium]
MKKIVSILLLNSFLLIPILSQSFSYIPGDSKIKFKIFIMTKILKYCLPFTFSLISLVVISCNNKKENSTIEESVIINGVCWATCNVDAPCSFADTPESVGMFYQWNRKIGWSATDPIINSIGGTTWDLTMSWDSTMSTSATWEKVNDPSPKGYRIPTAEEVDKLLETDKVTRESITTENGIDGVKFTDIATGNSLFLPMGCRNFDGSHDCPVGGGYWCNKPYNGYTNYGFFVRSVLE